MKQQISLLLTAILLVALGLCWSTKPAKAFPVEALDDSNGGSSLTSQEESGSAEELGRRKSSRFREGIVTVPPILASEWGLAFVDGVTIRQILEEEENDIGISFDELSLLQQEFGKRTDKAKKRKGIDAIFNAPGAQVVLASTGSQKTRNRRPSKNKSTTPIELVEEVTRPNNFLRAIEQSANQNKASDVAGKQPTATTVVPVTEPSSTTTTENFTTMTETPRPSDFLRRRTTTSRSPTTFSFEDNTTLPPFTTVTEAFASTTAPQFTEPSTTEVPSTESSSLNSELTPSNFARSSLAPITFAPTTETTVSTREQTFTMSSTQNPGETDYPDEEEDPQTIHEATIVNSFESVKSSTGVKMKSRTTTQAPVTASSAPLTTLADDPVQTTRNQIQSSTATETPRSISSTTALPFKIITETPINTADGTRKPIIFTIVTPQRTTVTITKTPPPSPATLDAISAVPATSTARPAADTSTFPPLLFSRSRTRPLNLTALTRGRVRNNQSASIGGNSPAGAITTIQEPRLDQDDGENEPAIPEEQRVTAAASDEDNLSFKRIKPARNKIFNTAPNPTTTTTTTTSTTTEKPTTPSEQPTTVAFVPSTIGTEVSTESLAVDNKDDSAVITPTTEPSTESTLNGNKRVGGRRPGSRKRVQDKASISNIEFTTPNTVVINQTPKNNKEEDLNEPPSPEELKVTAAASDEDNLSFKRLKPVNNKFTSTSTEINDAIAQNPIIVPTSTEASTDPVEVKEEAISTTTEAPSTIASAQSPSSRRTTSRRIGGRRPVFTNEATIVTSTQERASILEFGGRRPFSSRSRTTTTVKPSDEAIALESRLVEPTTRPRLPGGSRRRTTTLPPTTPQTGSQLEERVTLRPPRRRPSTTTTTPKPTEASTVNVAIAVESNLEEPDAAKPTFLDNFFGERAKIVIDDINNAEPLNVTQEPKSSTEATSEASELSSFGRSTLSGVSFLFGGRRTTTVVEEWRSSTESTSEASELPSTEPSTSAGIPSLFSGRRRTTTTPSPVSEAAGSNSGALQALLSGRRRTTVASTTQNPPTTVSANTVVIGRRRSTIPLGTTTTSSTTTTEASSVSEELASLAIEDATTDAPSTDIPLPASSTETIPSSSVSALESLLGRRPGRRRIDVTASNPTIVDTSTEATANPSTNAVFIRRPSLRTTTTEASISESTTSGVANLISGRRPGGRRTTSTANPENTSTEAPSGANTSGLARILARRPSIRTTTVKSTEETSSTAPSVGELRRVVPSRNLGNRLRPNTTTVVAADLSKEVDSSSVRTTRVLRPSFLNRAGQAAETSTADPGITSDQIQQIRDRIRARGRKIVASPVTIIVNDISTTSTSTTTEASPSALTESIEVASEQPVVAYLPSVTSEQPLAVAVPNVISELSIPPGVTEDPSGEFSLFPEGAIVLGVSSATEISEVIEIVDFSPNDSA